MRNLSVTLLALLALSSCSVYKIHKDGGYGRHIYPQESEVSSDTTKYVDKTKGVLMVHYMYNSPD
jgi:hypothetical protein